MKKFISRILAHPRLLFALAAIMCMGVEVFYFFCQWPLSEPPSPSSRVITSLVDAAVVFFPFLFLKKRWQWLVLVPFVVLPAIILANVAYLRSFGDIIAPREFGIRNAMKQLNRQLEKVADSFGSIIDI